MNEPEIIWQLVKDNFEQARAHEKYRADIVKLVITLTGILAGTLSVTGLGSQHQKIIYLTIAVIGFYGALASAKHYERFRMHVKIAQEFLEKLREGVLTLDVNNEFKRIQDERKWKHSWLTIISLNWLWTGFPAVLGLIGLLLLIFI